jgi:hypothetical protein
MERDKYVVDDEFLLGFLEALEPDEIDFRYVSHATYVRQGQSYKITGDGLRSFLADDIAFKDVTERRVFYFYSRMLHDIQMEVDYINARVAALFQSD